MITLTWKNANTGKQEIRFYKEDKQVKQLSANCSFLKNSDGVLTSVRLLERKQQYILIGVSYDFEEEHKLLSRLGFIYEG